ncbi:MAG: hypothetical protein M5U14_09435 [Acidimicrobiia bacterium]|nr:hypothetical protein [Acidimicrobiia bacterium]
MASKSAYFPGEARRSVVAPHEVPRRRWRPGEMTRVLEVSATTGAPTAAVWIEHRAHPGLAFRVEVDAAGALVAFTARPLAFIGESLPDGTRLVGGVADDGLPDGAPRITATLLRDLPLGQLHTAAVAGLGALGRVIGTETPPDRRRYRRSGLSDVELARFAAAYVEQLGRGHDDVAVRLGEQHHLSRHGVIYRIREARRRGLLTGTTRGRPGGILTDRGRLLLGP